MESYSLSDIAAVNGNNGMGGNSWFGMLALFAIIFGWGRGGIGGYGCGGYAGGQPVTEAGLCNAMNFNNLENAVGRLNDQAQTQFTQLANGLCQLGYQELQSFNQLGRQLGDYCCTIERGIDGVNYNNAMNTAAINANTTAQIQKVLDALCQNKIDALQSQLNQTQLQVALQGVVRYPNGFVYTAGNSPFCGYNTGGGTCCNV